MTFSVPERKAWYATYGSAAIDSAVVGCRYFSSLFNEPLSRSRSSSVKSDLFSFCAGKWSWVIPIRKTTFAGSKRAPSMLENTT